MDERMQKEWECGEAIAAVFILRAPVAIERPFDYLVPCRLAGQICRGSLVTVPFGRGNRREIGVCAHVRKKENTDAQKDLKVLTDLLPREYALTEEQFALCEFLRDYTLCTMGEAVYTVAPAAVRQGRDNRRTVKMLSLTLPYENALVQMREAGRVTAAQLRLAAVLQDGQPHDAKAALKLADVGVGVADTLLSRGVLRESCREMLRDPYESLRCSALLRDEIVLTTAQNQAYQTVLDLYVQERACAALLFGVTGSGKTKVILKMIDRVLADGKGVIMMVPEIALTPQTVGIFYQRYGQCAAVLHSSLSEGERLDAWRRISSGDARIVIGTRSAVFAPVPKLGLIVIDEEHEHTYKSDRNPKYHARDVAAFRAGHHGCPVMLASATPALESFEKACRGVYTLVPLRERFGGAPLPATEIVDMRKELQAGNRSPLSRRLVQALEETLSRGEQAILFLNRRGYSTSLQCRRCGTVITCPHCSVSLTYHAEGGAKLLCHCCGYRAPLPRACPQCGEAALSHAGYGTEKVASEIALALPQARVLRMDADTTAAKGAFDRILTSFRRGEADILLGTQMVTKGHDFPRVSLVGVVLADTSLYAADFRATERTFSLLTQVIGRAGRAGTSGLALMQSYTPDHELLALACRQDYEAFYHRESALRRSALFPPFCDMVQLTLSGEKEVAVLASAKKLFTYMTELAEQAYADRSIVIYGPFEAQVYRENDRFRMRMVVKCRLHSRTRAFFKEVLNEAFKDRNITLSVDIAPTSV